MITRNFNLFLNAGKHIPLVINVNQYDHDEQWCFTLLNDNGEKYIPSTGAIVGIKADRLGIINSGTVNASGQVVITETEQMTAAVGKAVFELLIDDQTHGTANFAVLVEPKPGNNADFSESDLSLLQEAIDGTSAAAIAEGVGTWMDDNLEPGEWVIDSSLTVQGAAADAKKVGDEISDLKSQVAQGGLTEDLKTALYNLASHIGAWIDGNAQTYIDALYDALYPPTNLSYITAVYSGGSVDEYASLDSLKADLVVTAHYDDLTTETVTTYALSGSLEVGTSTITVTYSGKTTTFDVTVIEGRVPNEYTEVQYLQSSQSSPNNGAYIDTGIAFNNPTLATYRIGVQHLQNANMNSGGEVCIGTRETSTGTTDNIGWVCQLYQTDKKTFISWSCSPGARFEPANQYEYHDIVATHKADETTIAGDNGEPAVLSDTMRGCSGYPIGLFGCPSNKTNTGATYLFNGRIYYAQAEQDGVLLFDLIPCTRNSDSKAGMWDRVTKTFITASKAGTGSASAITAGPVVSA